MPPMNNRALFKVFTLVASLCASQLVFGQIYKWVDEQGNVHFSDSPAKSTDARDISQDLPELNMTEGQNTGYTAVSREAETELKRKEQQDKQAQHAKREEACNKARKELSILSGPVYFTREDGSEYTIPESERANMEQELRAEIEHYCG